ncbi:AAA family ATPase [Chitinophaga agrisoli]|uniref:AAA family ATPase n=1 Tax=Chitinophaga agrisoli TaxID=2607653 RepID=A0A5B2VKK2_9BACT|nr:AAA family ATPase [Chitinophaga agrisoli]KAA2238777.1 AAA family ATPase [Chitinophaga agrisoli]
MQDLTKQLLDKYTAKRSLKTALQGRAMLPDMEAALPDSQAAPQDTGEEQRWSYRQAAAVLHLFSPGTLRPLAAQWEHKQVAELMYGDLVYISGEAPHKLYTLKPEIRKQALHMLGSRAAMNAALAANPNRECTELQNMWEGYLRSGTLAPLEGMGYQQLVNLRQIMIWVEGLLPGLPDPAVVQDLVRRKSILSPFEHLVDANFTGRQRELETLRKYLGLANETKRFLGAVADLWGKLMQEGTEPILSIYGPGGIGKSALIGRLLSELSQLSGPDRIPFAYLTFDQQGLRIDRPFTVLVEMAAQLGLQFPEHTKEIEAFHDSVRRYRDSVSDVVERRHTSVSKGIRIQESHATETSLYEQFAYLLVQLNSARANQAAMSPVLLTLDTFEEVQYRNREDLNAFWRMLTTIVGYYPQFKVIITGRGTLKSWTQYAGVVMEIPLDGLVRTDRVTLLGKMGVADKDVAEAVADQVGGNPLSLRLAAGLIKTDQQAAGKKGITGLNTRKWLLFQVDEQLIQGQLYKRILEHIHNPDLRKIAHPGMVLRVVYPELIWEVLAPVCGIEVADMDHATQLFEELKREHALVETGSAGTLIYRPEIRQAMIRLLTQDKFTEVRALHRAVVMFYFQKDDLTDRAEEMYHRLVLDEDETWQLAERWIPGIETSVISNLEEYSDRMKAWLSTRVNIEVPREILLNADVADWERNVTRKVKRALQENQLTWARELLFERRERTEASPLFALEAKTDMLLEDLSHATAVLKQGIEQLTRSSNRGRLAELWWLLSQVALMENDHLRADEYLANAEIAMANASDPLPLVHILCQRLILRQVFLTNDPEGAAILRNRLSTACSRMDFSAANRPAFICSLIVQLLADEFPETAARFALEADPQVEISAHLLLTENLRGMEPYREAWEEEEDNMRFEALV